MGSNAAEAIATPPAKQLTHLQTTASGHSATSTDVRYTAAFRGTADISPASIRSATRARDKPAGRGPPDRGGFCCGAGIFFFRPLASPSLPPREALQSRWA